MSTVLKWAGSLFVTAFAALFGGYITGTLNEYFPSPQELRCKLTKSTPENFNHVPLIILSPSDDDAVQLMGRISTLARSATGAEAFVVCSQIKIEDNGASSIRRLATFNEAHRLLASHRADLIIFGSRSDGVARLGFVTPTDYIPSDLLFFSAKTDLDRDSSELRSTIIGSLLQTLRIQSSSSDIFASAKVLEHASERLAFVSKHAKGLTADQQLRLDLAMALIEARVLWQKQGELGDTSELEKEGERLAAFYLKLSVDTDKAALSALAGDVFLRAGQGGKALGDPLNVGRLQRADKAYAHALTMYPKIEQYRLDQAQTMIMRATVLSSPDVLSIEPGQGRKAIALASNALHLLRTFLPAGDNGATNPESAVFPFLKQITATAAVRQYRLEEYGRAELLRALEDTNALYAKLTPDDLLAASAALNYIESESLVKSCATAIGARKWIALLDKIAPQDKALATSRGRAQQLVRATEKVCKSMCSCK